jgi:putative peptidoglycan lipid II flippase
LARDLAALPQESLHPAPTDTDRHERRERWVRIAWRVVPPLLVAGIGFAAWTVGSDLGRVPSPARALAPHLPPPHQRGSTTKGQVVWSKPPHITSFDPEGDGAEDPGGVGLAVDGDPTTQWTTDTYHDSPQFGGLKRGVGLLIDLGRPKTVRSAQLLLSAAGAGVQIRAGSSPPHQADDLPVVASQVNSPATTHLTMDQPVTARYWLVWFTSLPKSGADYRLGVAEIALQD